MVIFKSLIKAVLLLQEGDAERRLNGMPIWQRPLCKSRSQTMAYETQSDAEYKTLLQDKFEGSPSRQFVIEKLGDL